MPRNYPKVDLPILCTDGVQDQKLGRWCHDVLCGLEWFKGCLMPFAILAISRRRGNEKGHAYPAEFYDVPFLYEVFQDYTWSIMPKDMKDIATSKGMAWYAICHNYVSFHEILDVFNARYHAAYKIALKEGEEYEG